MAQLLGRIVEEHAAQAIAGILRADQVRERERHFLGGREAILAIEDHAVAAIEHQHGGAGALILGLVDVQIGYSSSSGTFSPSRWMAENSVSLTSRFSVSPNS
jgi:hypothetical protein